MNEILAIVYSLHILDYFFVYHYFNAKYDYIQNKNDPNLLKAFQHF